MIKILFMIPNLGQGGAEKVLVNLVNHMDKSKFDITVMTLYDEGVNRQFLSKHIKYQSCMKKSIPGISHLLKLFSPERLYEYFVKEEYDVVVSYLEGQTSRIISGCKNTNTKKLYWIHCTINSEKQFAHSFRNIKEARSCYSKFDSGVYVSQEVKTAFERFCPIEESVVLYNTNDSDLILNMSAETVDEDFIEGEEIKIISVGKIEPVKGFDRLAKVHKRLIDDGLKVHTYILGEGSQREKIEEYLKSEDIVNTFTFLGYQTNPYKYIAKSDLYVCSSHSEGFSTATTEALIIGVPVVTTHVSGMKEMLGENEYGVITHNDLESLHIGIKSLIDDSELLEHYKKKAKERGKTYSTENTVQVVEKMLLELVRN